MKKISILSTLLILVSSYFILTSYSAGITGSSTNGCSCHGAVNTATVITLTGVPTAGWVAGTTYNLTLTIANPTQINAGFDLTVDKGTLSSAPTNTALNGVLELHHTAPQSFASGTVSWSFNWTAPAVPTSTLVIFKVAGNACNANGQDTGDQYNKTTFSYTQFTVPTTPPTIALTNVGGITSTGATITASANANGANTAVSVEYGLTTSYGSTTSSIPANVSGTAATPVSTALSGLTASTLYHFRYKAANAAGIVYTADSTFTTLGIATSVPTIIVNSPTNISTTSATINAQVNANNANATVNVEYGLTIAYGSSVATTPSLVTGNVLTTVNASLSSLTPNTIYHYRIVATNSVGTSSSVDSTFMTNSVPTGIPTIVLNAITNLTATTATVNAQINANNSSTTVSLEYGLTAAYGNLINTTPNNVTGTVLSNVLANLTFLTPNTTYHYRIRAANAAGTAYSNDASFTTLSPEAINNISVLNMKLYPNPCTDNFYIETQNNSKNISLIIYSIQGIKQTISILQTGINQYQVDAKQLAKGYYILSILQDGKQATATIIKN